MPVAHAEERHPYGNGLSNPLRSQLTPAMTIRNHFPRPGDDCDLVRIGRRQLLIFENADHIQVCHRLAQGLAKPDWEIPLRVANLERRRSNLDKQHTCSRFRPEHLGLFRIGKNLMMSHFC